MQNSRLKQNLILFALLMIFVLPYLVAKWFYAHPWQTEKNNRGQLLRPPLLLNLKNFNLAKPQWLLLYIKPQVCDPLCQKRIYDMRQIRTALNADSERLTRVVLTPKEMHNKIALTTGFLYIVDPHGNVVLAYQRKQDPMDVLTDLKLLLKASQIG